MSDPDRAETNANFRHATVAIPLGLLVLLIGLVVLDGDGDAAGAAIYIGAAALIYGAARVAQGLYRNFA